MPSRNAPCPCGSGRKHKLCCGLTRGEERERAQRAALVEEIARLPMHFPRLRPSDADVLAWADRLTSEARTEFPLAEGIALVSARERARTERAAAKELQGFWRQVCEEVGDERLAREAVVAGAVAAAVEERLRAREPDLELIEERADVRADLAEALAFALEAADLWSLSEAARADTALAAIPEHLDDDEYGLRWEAVLAAQARRLTTRWHRRRLDELVRRLASRLPVEGRPLASAALASACDAYRRDGSVRERVAAHLLADSLNWLRFVLPAAA